MNVANDGCELGSFTAMLEQRVERWLRDRVPSLA